MLSRKPRTTLLAASLVLGFLFLVASYWADRRAFHSWLQDLLMNLAITFLGVVFAVAVVDELIRRHEDQRWERIRLRARTRIDNILTGTVALLSGLFGVPLMDPLPVADRLREDHAFRRTFTMDFATTHVLPAAMDPISGPLRLGEVDPMRWQQLAERMRSAGAQLDRLAADFSDRLPPDLQEVVFESSDAMQAFASWHDLVGSYLGSGYSGIGSLDAPATNEDAAILLMRQGAVAVLNTSIALLAYPDERDGSRLP